jgi:hypothetical protein
MRMQRNSRDVKKAMISPAIQIYEIIRDNDGIDLKSLRKLTGMQDKSHKTAFDRQLTDLQCTANIILT